MTHYLSNCQGSATGIGFIDSTSLKVCHNRRIFSHRVFDGIARRGKTSVDWFYGFKLHPPANFVVHLLAGLIAYCHLPHKPSVAIDRFALSSSC